MWDGLPEAGYADYAAMQAQIQAGYEDIAEKVGAGVAPVGIAWQKAIEVQPDLDLWQFDGIHPPGKVPICQRWFFILSFSSKVLLG